MPFMPFQTRPDFYYVYDMNRNSIYKITKQKYESLCRVKSDKSELRDVATLEEFQKKGMLLDSPVTKVQHPATQYLKYQLERCVSSITFQMSQNCNLRCSYCPYSDNGIYDSRVHTDKNMKWEIVQQGIDFLITNSKDIDNLHIAFYGGEPLIVKELIIRAMKYAVEQVNGKKISFGMTTNATLLDDDFAKAVSEYDITIMVSLDGPKEIHDKNRAFVDGRGSFDVIYKNISNIKNKYKDLYDKLKYNTVIAPNSDYREIFDFFRKNQDICNLSKVSLNTLSSNYTDKTFVYEDTYFEESNYETLKAFLLLLGKLEKEPAPNHKTDIDIIFGLKEFLSPIEKTPSIAHPSGTCIPGLKKLFVDVNGNFFPCERIDENSTLMQIGNIKEGFDVDKVSEVLNVGAVTENECKNCWAFYNCSICPVSADNGKDEYYLNSYKLSKCNRVKDSALENIKNYTMLKEFKYQFDKEALLL